MKKTLIGLMCIAMLCMCGCSGKATVKSVDGDYVSLGFDLSGNDYGYDFTDDELDEFLEETIDGDEPSYTLSLDESKFEAEFPGGETPTIYEGSYQTKDGVDIKFEYEEMLSLDTETKKWRRFKIDGEENVIHAKRARDRMNDLNKKNNFGFNLGSYGATSNEKLSTAHMYLPALNIAPVVELSFDGVYVFIQDDFICREAPGAALEGKYKHGKDFTMTYNYFDTLEMDETSPCYHLSKEERLDYISKMQDSLADSMGVDGDSRSDFDTTIEFEDGEWEMYNKNGDLLNNGEYQESEEYEGLIVMYVTEDSEIYYETEKAGLKAQRIFLYIHDGEIYAPIFIKSE